MGVDSEVDPMVSLYGPLIRPISHQYKAPSNQEIPLQKLQKGPILLLMIEILHDLIYHNSRGICSIVQISSCRIYVIREILWIESSVPEDDGAAALQQAHGSSWRFMGPSNSFDLAYGFQNTKVS